MRRGVRVYSHRGVNSQVKRLARNITNWFSTECDVEHWLPVSVVSQPVLKVDSNRTAFGVFRYRHGANEHPHIFVAGGLYLWLKSEGESKQDALDQFGWVLMHELVHYEQFRDGRPVQERGVNLRAKNLYRRFRADTLLTNSQFTCML